jgi:hypothetical protein
MMMRQAAWLAGLSILLASAPAFAQTSSYYSGSQTNGMFGSNTLGGSSSANYGTGSSSGSSSTNSSSSGSRTTGSVQPNVAMSNQNVATQAIQNTRKQTQGAFVGADTADTGNFLSRQNTATTGTTGTRTTGSRSGANNGLAQLQSLFQQNQQGMNGQNQSQPAPQIRVALRLGFRPQPVSTARVQSFQSRLTRLPEMRFIGPAQVVMEGRTAVLRGKVATEEDRELAEALAMMEPEVLRVRNELVVEEPSSSDATPVATP